MASFVVRKVFALPDRDCFVAGGEIAEGKVSVGMKARMEPIRGRFEGAVSDVESLLLAADTGESLVALVFRYDSSEQLGEWQALDWNGAVLELTK